MLQTCEPPERVEMKMIRLPSGVQRGGSLFPSRVIWRGEPPPSTGTIQMCLGLVFWTTSTVWTVNAISLPSGETCGSLMRLSLRRASTSKGRLWADICWEESIAEANRTKMWIRRIVRTYCSSDRLGRKFKIFDHAH